MLKHFDSNTKKTIFFVFVLALAIHQVFVFAGFYEDDDIFYARYAARIAQNGFTNQPAATDHLQLRWLLIYVTAFFYKLFGINDFTSSLCSFISVLGSGFLLSKIVQKYNIVPYTLTLLLFFFTYVVLFNMHRTLPDSTICFAVLWMYYSYRSYREKALYPLKYGLQFSLGLCLAIITKETIIIALPLFVVIFLYDLYKKKNFRFWWYAIPVSFGLVFLYLLFFKITTGSFFFRYNLIQANSYFNECSYEKLPLAVTLNRIAYLLCKGMLYNGEMLIMIPAIAGFIYRKKIQEYTTLSNMDCFSFVVLLGAANFMTISFTDYVPLCPAPRHFLFLLPFAAICGAPMLFAYLKAPRRFLILPALFLISAGILFYVHAGNNKYVYFGFAIILMGSFLGSYLPNRKQIFNISFGAVILLFSSNYLIDFLQPKYTFFKDHRKLADKTFTTLTPPATVFSADLVSSGLSEYFLKFKNKDLKFLPKDSIKSFNTGNLYYMVVADMDPVAQRRLDSLKKYTSSAQLLLIDKENNVSLYKLDDATLKILKQ